MNTSRKEEEGHALMAEAEKKLEKQGGGFFRSLFGSSASKEEAAETFVNAANCFRLAKSWTLAGTAFERAADAYNSTPDLQYEAASKYAEAAKAYKNADSAKAVAAYEKAIATYTDSARFQQCARYKKEVAEIFEAEGNQQGAVEAYTAAADFYDMEDAKSNANSMRVKVAMISALLGKYMEAAELYEQVAQNALGSNMLKYGAREHLLRAGLCRLCVNDIVGAQNALDKYRDMDPTFDTSREGKLLASVVQTVEEGDAQAFTDCVYEYDSVSKLDEWKTSILLKIKGNIKAEEDDLT